MKKIKDTVKTRGKFANGLQTTGQMCRTHMNIYDRKCSHRNKPDTVSPKFKH